MRERMYSPAPVMYRIVTTMGRMMMRRPGAAA